MLAHLGLSGRDNKLGHCFEWEALRTQVIIRDFPSSTTYNTESAHHIMHTTTFHIETPLFAEGLAYNFIQNSTYLNFRHQLTVLGQSQLLRSGCSHYCEVSVAKHIHLLSHR